MLVIILLVTLHTGDYRANPRDYSKGCRVALYLLELIVRQEPLLESGELGGLNLPGRLGLSPIVLRQMRSQPGGDPGLYLRVGYKDTTEKELGVPLTAGDRVDEPLPDKRATGSIHL